MDGMEKKASFEVKKEELKRNLLRRVAESHVGNKTLGSRAADVSRAIGKEGRNIMELTEKLAPLYDEFLAENQGIPPTEDEFWNYAKSKGELE